MITETLTWYDLPERLPDDDRTVVYEAPDSDEPIWLGYLDGDQWRSAEGVEIEGVVRWAEMPRGGLK